MAKEIVWSKRANLKFNSIIDFLEHEWGDKVTSDFVQRTYDILNILSTQSELGTLENQSKVKKSEDFLSLSTIGFSIASLKSINYS